MRFPALSLVFGLLLFLAVDACALDWPWKRGARSKSARHTPRVRLEPFSGATGATAMRMLREQLISAGEVFPVGEGEEAGFAVSGSSVGGRVVGRLVNDKGKELFERTYAAPGLEENIKALTDDVIYTITGTPGLATSQIVFVSDVSGQKQVYLCDSNGGNVERVTHDRFGSVSPSLCANASLLAYTTYKTGFSGVAVVDMAGGHERLFADTPGGSSGAAISPNGERIALTMGFVGAPQILVTNLPTGSANCITETLGVPCCPTWHPKEPLILFACDEGRGPRLWLASVEGEPRVRLWRTGFSFATDPEWSPDGKQVAFTARSGGSFAVVVKGYPSGRARVVAGGGAQHPTWSPNGRYLAFAKAGALWLHDLKSDEGRALLSGFGKISEPCWMR